MAFGNIPVIDTLTISGKKTTICISAFCQNIEPINPFEIIWTHIRSKPLVIRIPSSTIWEYPDDVKEDMAMMKKEIQPTKDNTYTKEALFSIFNFKVEIIDPTTNDTQTTTTTATTSSE